MINSEKIASYDEFIEEGASDFCTAIFPSDVWEDEDGLYRLPDGRYLPIGVYAMKDEAGGDLIYEPLELSPISLLLEQCDED